VESGGYRIATCNTNNLIFSFAQMLAHHTRGGCPLRTGDLIATGTISGENPDQIGCFLESTQNGKFPYELSAETGSEGTLIRTFLEDWDTVEFSAQARTKDGFGVGFGVCGGQVLPSA
jgi:fumarylacetoacetase